MKDSELIEWLKGKLAEAENALSARNQASKTWREGTDKSWKEAGCKLKKVDRIAVADSHARIAEKCMRDVAMFKATIAIVSKPMEAHG